MNSIEGIHHSQMNSTEVLSEWWDGMDEVVTMVVARYSFPRDLLIVRYTFMCIFEAGLTPLALNHGLNKDAIAKTNWGHLSTRSKIQTIHLHISL